MSEVGDIEDLFGMLEDERGADAPEEIEMKTPEVISASEFDDAADLFSGVVEAPEEEVHITFHRETPKVGRNDLCPCGSGKKYKKCCGKEQ